MPRHKRGVATPLLVDWHIVPAPLRPSRGGARPRPGPSPRISPHLPSALRRATLGVSTTAPCRQPSLNSLPPPPFARSDFDGAADAASRQTLMFSATWPREVRELANEFQHAPVRINVGSTDKLVASDSITQHVTVVEHPREKLERLIELVQEQEAAAAQAAEEAAAASAAPRGRGRSGGGSSPCHTAVFVNRKKDIESIARKLSAEVGNGMRVVALHGDMQQPARDRNLELVKTGRAQARRTAPHMPHPPSHASRSPALRGVPGATGPCRDCDLLATDEEPSPK